MIFVFSYFIFPRYFNRVYLTSTIPSSIIIFISNLNAMIFRLLLCTPLEMPSFIAAPDSKLKKVCNVGRFDVLIPLDLDG